MSKTLDASVIDSGKSHLDAIEEYATQHGIFANIVSEMIDCICVLAACKEKRKEYFTGPYNEYLLEALDEIKAKIAYYIGEVPDNVKTHIDGLRGIASKMI